MKKPARFILKNHRGCAYCSDAEMVIDNKGPLVGYAFYELLEAENARLKAEVKRLRHLEGVASSVDFYQQENEKLNEEIERLTMIKDACKRMIKRRDKRIFELKAELAHLRASSFVTAVPVEEYEKLQAEVERLTKSHSDALADFWAIHKGYFDLKAEVEQLRKEGKPHA